MLTQITSLWVAQGNPVLPRVGSTNAVVEWAIIALLLFIVVTLIAGRMSTDRDSAWLPSFVMWGFIVKLLGSLARYYMVTDIYGRGDAFSYHFQGTFLANAWRALEVPMSSAGGEGTAFTEVTTSLIYAIYPPNMVSGFLVFAFIAFLGQLLFYAAFRPALPDSKLKLYAIAILFVPSVVFWPASIGKDSLMMLFLGLAIYGASRLLATYAFSSLLPAGLGLFLAAQIRPHVAAMVALAIVLAAVFGKTPKPARGSPKRFIMLGFAVAGTILALATFSRTFGVTLEPGAGTQDPRAFLDQVSERTAQGGSEITGGAVESIDQLPMAIVTVLFRPLLGEGGGSQLISSVEGTALLLITVRQLPTMWRNRRRLREKPLLLMAFFYTGGFVIAFSAILNLGIVARQRVQVLPMILAVLIALGFDKKAGRSKAKAKYAGSAGRPPAAASGTRYRVPSTKYLTHRRVSPTTFSAALDKSGTVLTRHRTSTQLPKAPAREEGRRWRPPIGFGRPQRG